MASPLEDLDELTLRCKDGKARQHIAEAVASYRAGAFRATIVATWIAVCFDVIEKIRELALAGDKDAEQQAQEIETTRRTGDLARALKFERELLGLARDKFELISPLEHIDLARLQDDRNRCAHPSLTSEEQAYTPSAELARLHIHSAVIHLLQHPPVQGKYALERLLKEIESDYFPSTVDAAIVSFSSGPLKRPRESLIRNLVLILCKVLLKEKPEWKRRHRISAALQAIQVLHPIHCSNTKKEKLSTLFRAVPDEEIFISIFFLRNVPDSWQYLDPDVHQRLQNYVTKLPASILHEVDFLLEYAPLQQQARHRIRIATKEELSNAIFFDLPKEVADKYIDLYLDSDSYREANEWAKEMAVHSDSFTQNQIRRLITGISQNNQITGSNQLGYLISKIRSHQRLPEQEFENLLIQNGLGEFCLD
ncbi:hypothetical protein ACEUBH_07355 [Aeromonas veronii]